MRRKWGSALALLPFSGLSLSKLLLWKSVSSSKTGKATQTSMADLRSREDLQFSVSQLSLILWNLFPLIFNQSINKYCSSIVFDLLNISATFPFTSTPTAYPESNLTTISGHRTLMCPTFSHLDILIRTSLCPGLFPLCHSWQAKSSWELFKMQTWSLCSYLKSFNNFSLPFG